MLLLFQSTHDVIMAEKAIREQGIRRRVIPVPRSISSQCGMALEIDKGDKVRVLDLLDSTVFADARNEGQEQEKRYKIYEPMDEQ